MAVYDGHGAHGQIASKIVRDTIPNILPAALLRAEGVKGRAKALERSFVCAEAALRTGNLDHMFSGTTGTCVWVIEDEVFVAWAGDSRCVMGGAEGAVELTSDHKAAREDEKNRVRKAGGRVTRWRKGCGPERVWLPSEWVPGLAMTRSIGDTVLSKYGVVAKPEVTVTRVVGGEFLVVASDGVWEFMESDEVAEFVKKAWSEGVEAEQVAKQLVNEAVRRWRLNESVVDDTTAVVVFLGGIGVKERECKSKDRFWKRRNSQQVTGLAVPWLISGGRIQRFSSINVDAEHGNGS